MNRFLKILGMLAVLAYPTVEAREVAGITLADRARVGNAELMLNGAGIRTRFLVRVYVASLYLTTKTGDAESAISAPGAKRIQLVTLRDVTASQFADAMVENLLNNHSAAEMAKLQAPVDGFKATLLALQDLPKGTVVTLDHIPGAGTQLGINGVPKGEAIAGEDFYRALLRIWLGTKPVQDDLKSGLLGSS